MSNIVVAIAGKTCSGKTFLLNQLLNSDRFVKLVTSTTRGVRDGETEGQDYHFIQSALAEYLLDNNRFIEYNVYGNHVYGLTSHELEDKMQSGKIPCVILTPNGVDAYKKLLAESYGITVISIFIDCPQPLLVERLAARTLKESELNVDTLKIAFDRAISVALNEQSWRNYLDWDLVVSAGKPNLDQQLIKFINQFSNT